MNKFSERLFEALFVEIFLGIIALAVNDKFTQLLLIGLGTLIVGTIAFVPRIVPKFTKTSSPIDLVPQTKSQTVQTDSVILNFPSKALWFQWVITNATANTAWAILNEMTINSFSDQRIASLISGVIGGIVAGILQWLILRKQFTNASRWVVVTILGWGVGSLLLSFWVTSSGQMYISSAISGLAVGLFQWLVLRQHFENAGWWIPANVTDWILYIPIGLSILPLIKIDTIWGSGVYGVIVGAMSAFVTGIALIYVLRKPVLK